MLNFIRTPSVKLSLFLSFLLYLSLSLCPSLTLFFLLLLIHIFFLKETWRFPPPDQNFENSFTFREVFAEDLWEVEGVPKKNKIILRIAISSSKYKVPTYWWVWSPEMRMEITISLSPCSFNSEKTTKSLYFFLPLSSLFSWLKFTESFLTLSLCLRHFRECSKREKTL